ncbi:MAG: NAD(P)-dependent oxidoreductase [Candidatus Rokubacteria bacterium]|nr:NAD(P)-dependent oxidoreductase [Candidatus Rokubacteria bacterium]
MSGRRVAITGGEGFIGAHLARRLAEEGDEVHILSRPNPARPWKLPDLLGVVARVHPVELLDRGRLGAIIDTIAPEEVYHLAGRVDLERTAAMAQLCVQENVVATVNLLDALQAGPAGAVVYASTTEVYGAGPIPFREDQAVEPPSPYAVSKLAGESFCRLWATTFACPVRVVRMAAAYGPGQRPQRLIPSVIVTALRREPITLRSPGHRRDFLYVSDAVDGLVRAARGGLAPGETVNVGSLDAVGIREVVDMILARMGCKDVPVAIGDEGRIREAPCWTTDSARARARLGWAPRVPLGEGLDRTIAWYRRLAERGGAP